MKKMRRIMEMGIYIVLISIPNRIHGIRVKVMNHFCVLRSGNIYVSEAVRDDMHIHVLIKTRSDDEILKRSYQK